MVRHIALGNGQLLVNVDQWLQVRDVYFPYPGQENHVLGHANRTGVFADGHLSWINEDAWQRSIAYKKKSSITECTANNPGMQVELAVNDVVHCSKNIFLRKFTLTNTADHAREFTLFFHHDYHLYGDGVGDTAGYDPVRKALFHYKRERYVLIAPLLYQGKKMVGQMHQYSVGGADNNDTFEDAQDGELNLKPIAQGSVDSICSIKFSVEAGKSATVFYVTCLGQSFSEVYDLYDQVLSETPPLLFKETDMCWQGLVSKRHDLSGLSTPIKDLFTRSLLTIHSQIGHNGAITAANDSDNREFNKDTYSYVWMRDAALVTLALLRAGYYDVTKQFFSFAEQTLANGGFFLHKYNPDGSLGSSWHPWADEGGNPQLAIQEDETALVLVALWDYYERTKDQETIAKLYETLIKPCAEFMSAYMHEDLDLPQESYDLWEERRGVLTFTCSTVVAGLSSAGKLAALMKDKDASKYEELAKKINQAVGEHLFSSEHNRFARMLSKKEGGHDMDLTLESSTAMTFLFGGFDPLDPKVVGTMQQIEKDLWVNTPIGGVARYTNDYYYQKTQDVRQVPGNPWFITTLWVAKWHIAKAASKDELGRAVELLEWCASHALPTGILPEQLHPFTGEPLSVAPLTWSHAEFVDTVLRLQERKQELK